MVETHIFANLSGLLGTVLHFQKFFKGIKGIKVLEIKTEIKTKRIEITISFE